MGAYDWAGTAFFGTEAAADRPGEEGPPTRFIAFDLETTGLYPAKDRIVEIGAVKFDRRGPIGRFSVLIDPRMPMPAEASRINGITDAMLAGKPVLDQVLPDFLRFIGDGVLIAHNASFDCSFVNAALKERWETAQAAAKEDAAQISLLDDAPGGDTEPSRAKTVWAPPFPALPNRVVDTLAFAKETIPGRAKYNMQELASFLGIKAMEAHRAEDDARVCMELFIKLAERRQGRSA